MSKFVNPHMDFGMPMVILVLTERKDLFHDLFHFITRENPAAMEKEVLSHIVFHRPDLAGGFLVAMDYALERNGWEFLYAHPSLPRTESGAVLEKWPLIPVPNQIKEVLRAAKDGDVVVLPLPESNDPCAQGHDKCYDYNTVLTSYPPKRVWICRRCRTTGYDPLGEAVLPGQSEYDRLRRAKVQ